MRIFKTTTLFNTFAGLIEKINVPVRLQFSRKWFSLFKWLFSLLFLNELDNEHYDYDTNSCGKQWEVCFNGFKDDKLKYDKCTVEILNFFMMCIIQLTKSREMSLNSHFTVLSAKELGWKLKLSWFQLCMWSDCCMNEDFILVFGLNSLTEFMFLGWMKWELFL